MKLFLVAFAVIAAVAADVSHLPSNEYLPPVQEEVQTIAAPSNEYLAPVANEAAYSQVEQGSLADDGYRYKTHRRVVLRRHRRDVSHLPSNEYLPPVQEEAQIVAAPTNEYLAPAVEESVPQGNLADDGYRYKTHRRVVYRRNRRDVSHLPSNEYLPPVQEQVETVAAPTNEYLAPAVEEAVPQGNLADDGYRYKTHRRVVYRRNRRDVSHLPSNEYLPPVQEQVETVAAPTNEYLAPAVEEAVPQGNLADDGYRYKTHRRVVYRRNRRDVSHLPSNEYLPPVAQVAAPAPSNEYLPPVQAVQTVAAPAPVQISAPAPVQYAAPVHVEEAAPAHELADDGYRYKTHRRVVYRRNRRDVSHLPSNEYLPPVQEAQTIAAPTSEYLPPVSNTVEEVAVADQGNLADDGYRYKTHRRVVLRRHRRDVSHLPSNEYLPPVQEEAQIVAAPTNEYLAPAVEEAVPQGNLADDGYRYKTHRRVVYRRNRRDVSHLPSNEYLPPVAQVAAPAPSNEYLPPVQAVQTVAAPAPVFDVPAPVVEAAPAHELADDGYRYKTHRRVVYRRRH